MKLSYTAPKAALTMAASLAEAGNEFVRADGPFLVFEQPDGMFAPSYVSSLRSLEYDLREAASDPAADRGEREDARTLLPYIARAQVEFLRMIAKRVDTTMNAEDDEPLPESWGATSDDTVESDEANA